MMEPLRRIFRGVAMLLFLSIFTLTFTVLRDVVMSTGFDPLKFSSADLGPNAAFFLVWAVISLIVYGFMFFGLQWTFRQIEG